MHYNGNLVAGLVEREVNNRGNITSPITISDACIIEIGAHIFLIVLINFNNSEAVVVIRICREQARDLMRDGVRNCAVLSALPTEFQRRAVDLVGIFVVDGFAFLIFETERSQERLERIFVVRFPLTPITPTTSD